MLASKTKYIWAFSLLLLSLVVTGFFAKYPINMDGSADMPRAIGNTISPWFTAGLLALIYAAINRFKAEKMTAVYYVWTSGVIVFLIIKLLA